MTDNNILVIFKAISNFTQALSDEFSKKQRTLALYSRLINKTTLAHDKPIEKHINAFKQFCISNRDAILAKDSTLLITSNITYSERVYINMKNIFNMADEETTQVIWEHLLTISALVDPSSKAKEILKESLNNVNINSNFLSEIFKKVENNLDPNASPMEAINSMMKSGLIQELLGTMNSKVSDGSLNLEQLLSSVQELMSQFRNSTEGENPMEMMSGLMSMMSNMATNNQDVDMSGLMSMLGNMATNNQDVDTNGLMSMMSNMATNNQDVDMNGLMSMMSNMETNNQDVDMSGLMNMMSNMETNNQDLDTSELLKDSKLV